MRNAITIDFETFPIRKRPLYPPKPCGLAIKWGSKKGRYFDFAHANHVNAHTYSQAKEELKKAWGSGLPLVFHNAKFDLDVAYTHFGMAEVHRDRINDTTLLLFLQDPRVPTFALKLSAFRLLGMAPLERDDVVNWLVENQPIPGVRLTDNPGTKPSDTTEYAGAYIAYAPPKLVGPYAIGDVDRTKKLFDHLMPEITKRGMLEAYDRDRYLIEPVLHMERNGIAVDVTKLAADVNSCEASLQRVDDWLEKKTKVCGVNWDSGQQRAKALIDSGLVDKNRLGTTKTGKIATNKKSLAKALDNVQLKTVLRYRSRLASSLRTFMRPWLAMAMLPEAHGRIYTTWHTTRSDDHGAKTGRQSSTPNLQNMEKRRVELFEKTTPAWWKKLGFFPLPTVRGYILPDKGHRLVDRDYSQQELRILAHYAGGDLLEKYLDNPWLDVHAMVQETVSRLLDREVDRTIIKPIVFGIVYGMGKPGMELVADAFSCDIEEVLSIRDAIKKALPGIGYLNQLLRSRCASGQPMRTWGGREYYVEEPKFVKGLLRTYEYKMLNLLIQGSAADATKQAILHIWEFMVEHKLTKIWKILLTIHDEIVLSVPEKDVDRAHRELDEAMKNVKFQLPMLSEGKTGKTLGSLEPHDKKGDLCRL